MDTMTLVQLFGNLAGLACIAFMIWKFIVPRMDAANAERIQAQERVYAEMKKTMDLYIALVRETTTHIQESTNTERQSQTEVQRLAEIVSNCAVVQERRRRALTSND